MRSTAHLSSTTHVPICHTRFTPRPHTFYLLMIIFNYSMAMTIKFYLNDVISISIVK